MPSSFSNTNTRGGRGIGDRALVTFRIAFPTDKMPRTVHLVGSWDNFSTALPMDQDLRVGRGVWKGMVTERGGLVMGHDYTYYFLLNSKTFVPDPASTPDLTMVDPTSGRLVSTLYVPLELPPSPEKPPNPPPHLFLSTQSPTPPMAPLDEKAKTISPVSVIGSSVFAGSSDEGGLFEEPRKVPEHPSVQSPIGAEAPGKDPGSLRGKARGRTGRRMSIFQFGAAKDVPVSTEEIAIRKRGWTLAKKASGIFRGRSKARAEDDDKVSKAVDRSGKVAAAAKAEGIAVEVLPKKQVPPPTSMKSSNKISDIVGYLRETSSEMSINGSGGLRPQPAQAYYHSPVTSNRSSATNHQQNQRNQRNQHPRPEPHPQPCPISPQETILFEVADIASNTIENSPSPSLYHSVASACSCHALSACSCSPNISSPFSPDESCASDDEVDERDGDSFGIETPTDGLGISAPQYSTPKEYHSRAKEEQASVYPKYYNFDEVSAGAPGGNRDIGRYAGDVILDEANNGNCGFAAGGMKSLGRLREEVAGELSWRAELVDELGYLGGIVV
ncbi:unnamed protein product [Tuber aestivum]|uniref:AMP-activated protein kinase glycogen-binding domain-containing protein n=1 Tax=Tuber aestivum TaxID=59557 RepID=A0A292PQJ7_9PEZI|nr:unnamed protein product [Tuber aestivum]